MKKVRKILTLGLLSVSLLSISIPAYASETMSLISVQASKVPACPSCGTNKYVVAHGVIWACMKCGDYFYGN